MQGSDGEQDLAAVLAVGSGWPQSRHMEEEELVNAAESRLLSIVGQLKSGKAADVSNQNVATQLAEYSFMCTTMRFVLRLLIADSTSCSAMRCPSCSASSC